MVSELNLACHCHHFAPVAMKWAWMASCLLSDPPLSLANKLPQGSQVHAEMAGTKKAMSLARHRLCFTAVKAYSGSL